MQIETRRIGMQRAAWVGSGENMTI